jgi:type I restriction-modification system DNA methylase subunit
MAKKTVATSTVPETEVEAYGFIRQQLHDLGWSVKNPNLNSGGQVWTQNQCLGYLPIKEAFVAMRPENVVKVRENCLWIIEAKASRKHLAKAVEEAQEDYAKKINDKPGTTKALLATGVAGTEELGYLIRTTIRIDGIWHEVTINGQVATGLLSPQQAMTLTDQGISDVHEYAPPQRLFLNAAERINETLHIGGINKNDRAKTMAALLLSVIDEPPNLDTKLSVLIAEINARSEAVLRQHGKPDFAPFVKILPPTNTTNHVKFKAALVRTIQELHNLNIRSAMNSSTDVLGQFYEVFLKYGNGAKEIGIVLTPRHITRFGVEAIGVSSDDIVLDPACGTGGFLVAAFDHVQRNSTPQQRERFKKYNIFGIEQESAVAALAIVNMIFRGDGKNNIVEGNAFSTYLTKRSVNGHATAAYVATPPESGNEPVTRVLMNPPFALKGSTDKEYRFVSQALSTMADGKIFFCLLPLNTLFGSHDEKVWRRDELLAKHTLLAVITLPEKLFYPAALKQVAAVIIKKGVPHPPTQSVFWAMIAKDGHILSKSKRLLASEFSPPRNEPDQLPEVLPYLQNFIAHPKTTSANQPKFFKTAPIDFADPLLELLPEAYLDADPLSTVALRQAVEETTRETVVTLVRFAENAESPSNSTTTMPKFSRFMLSDIFDLEAGAFHSTGSMVAGQTPIISCGELNNGVCGFFDVSDKKVYSHKLTIACDGSTLSAKYHPYQFSAYDNVAVCFPKKKMRITTLLFIQIMLGREKWRFSYYRKCYLDKLSRVMVPLPAKGGKIDEDAIETIMSASSQWEYLSSQLHRASYADDLK